MRNKILPIHNESFQEYLYTAGVPDDLTYDLLGTFLLGVWCIYSVIERMAKEETLSLIKEVVFLYEQLYLSYTNLQFGTISLAKPYNNTFNDFFRRAQQLAVAAVAEEGNMVEFAPIEVKILRGFNCLRIVDETRISWWMAWKNWLQEF